MILNSSVFIKILVIFIVFSVIGGRPLQDTLDRRKVSRVYEELGKTQGPTHCVEALLSTQYHRLPYRYRSMLFLPDDIIGFL